jgi:hypothetical protein
MKGVLTAADMFIWGTSIAAGVVLCLAAYRWLLAKSLPIQSRALLGDWYGYGHFHSRGGDLFYKERISVTRDWIQPWRLRIVAQPDEQGSETTYRGLVWSKPPFIFCSTFEPIFGDRTFEISRRTMDDRHEGNMVVGICLGMSYDENVHCATAHIWSRAQLDPEATSQRPADRAIERKRFIDISRDYFVASPDTLQLKLK